MERAGIGIITYDKAFCGILLEYFRSGEDAAVVSYICDEHDDPETVMNGKPDILLLDMIFSQPDTDAVIRAAEKACHDELPDLILLCRGKEEAVSAYRGRCCCADPLDMSAVMQCIRDVSFNENNGCRAEDILNSAGIPSHLKGYTYLRDAVLLAAEDRDIMGAVTKELYPAVAHMNSTTPAGVERAMRHAIRRAYMNAEDISAGSAQVREEATLSVRPANSEFIAAAADMIRNKY